VTPSDPLVARAGVLVVTEELSEEGFRWVGVSVLEWLGFRV
jgi:hypothetical protein